MKNIAPWALLFIILPALLPAQNDKALIDRVVATVGSEIILLSEVQEQFSYAKQQNPELPADFQCVAVQNLIVQKLLVNQAKLDSIAVTEEEVETQLNARIDRLMLYFNQDSKAIEDFYGQTIDQIKSQTRTDMRNQLLAERRLRPSARLLLPVGSAGRVLHSITVTGATATDQLRAYHLRRR